MPITIIAEIGINHNGDINIAKKLIDAASASGCDYVKFQKRTPNLCVPDNQKNVVRQTPWGDITYLEYKHKLEFDADQYKEINDYCLAKNIKWSASAWDIPSIKFLEQYNLDFIKIPSALMTDCKYLKYAAESQSKYLLSTGMCDFDMVDYALNHFVCPERVYGVLHCTSTYPTKTEEMNLNCIKSLKIRYPECKVGFSNHHPGIVYMPVSVALGAEIIEMHITLDRSMWGTDHSASIEPQGVSHAVKYIRGVEEALGDGYKKIYESEIPIMEKLRCRH